MDILDSQLEKPEKSSLQSAGDTSNYISPPKPKIPNQFDYTTKSQEKTNEQRPPFFTGFSVKDQQEFSSKIKLKGDPAVPTSPLKKPEALKSSPIEIMHEPADLKFKNVPGSDTDKKEENDLDKFIEKVPEKKEPPTAAESFGAAPKDSAASANPTSLSHTYGNPAGNPFQKKEEAPKFSYSYDQSKVWSSWAPPLKNKPASQSATTSAPAQSSPTTKSTAPENQPAKQPEQKESPQNQIQNPAEKRIAEAAGAAPAASVAPISPVQTPAPSETSAPSVPTAPIASVPKTSEDNPYSQDLKAIEKLYSSTSTSDRGANISVDAHPDPSKIFKGGPVNSPKITEEARERIKKNNSLAPIRTFEADTADAIRNKNASVIDIALAEKKKRELYQTEDRAAVPFFKSFFVITLSVILVSGGLAAVGYYGYKYWNESFKPNPVVITDQPLISYDVKIDLALKDAPKKDILKVMRGGISGFTPRGKIAEVNLTESLADKKSIDTQKFIQDIQIKNMPAALGRSLDSKFMIGIYSAKNDKTNSAFIILKNNSYENAFSGMLGWEKGMIADIGDLFTEDMTNASSTVNVDDIYTMNTSDFQDEIISNKDARVIKNEFGKILFLYSFIDQNTIVITTSPEALNEIAARNAVAKIVK